MEKETLEEILSQKIQELDNCNLPGPFQGGYVNGFVNGAKWQQEKMYSEEEVLQLLLRLQQTESYDNLYDWFEQFKKN